MLFLRIWLLVFALHCMTYTANAAEVDALLTMLEARARTVSVLKWRFESYSIRGPDVFALSGNGKAPELLNNEFNDLNDYRREGTSIDGLAIADFRKLNFKIEFKFKSTDKAQTTVERYQTVAFNGNVFAKLTLPPRGSKTKSQVVLASEIIDVSTTNSRLGDCGYNLFPSRVPLIVGAFGIPETSVSVSEFVAMVRSRKENVTFSKLSDEEWKLVVPVRRYNKEFGNCEFVFNPKLGGSLSRIRRVHFGKNQEEILFTTARTNTGKYLPRKVVRVHWTSGTGSCTTVDDIVEMPNSIGEDYFKIKIPQGAVVQDNARRMVYIASSGPINEAEATARYGTENGLSVGYARTRRSTYRFIMAVSMLVVFAFCMFRYRRRLSLQKGIGLTSLCFLLGCGEAKVEPQGSETVLRNDNAFQWDNVERNCKLAFGGSEATQVTQCGFSVTTLAMAIFGKKFDPHTIAHLLKPTASGIRMSYIKETLEIHGISVDARKHVSLRELIPKIQTDMLAIAHIPQYNATH